MSVFIAKCCPHYNHVSKLTSSPYSLKGKDRYSSEVSLVNCFFSDDSSRLSWLKGWLYILSRLLLFDRADLKNKCCRLVAQ
jgi:hypothetical protein